MTFFVECRFWVKSLRVWYYKNHVDRKKIKDNMGITLWSLETYG